MHEVTRYTLTKPVFLVGFMGAGKTTAAKISAKWLGVSSLDMDRYIARFVHCSVPEFFNLHGEEKFRGTETHVLKKITGLHPMIVSCGGGIVIPPENRKILKSAGCCIHLNVSPQESVGRISNIKSRPLLKSGSDPVSIYHDRLPLYQEVAHYTLDTAGMQPKDVAAKLRDLLIDEGIVVQVAGKTSKLNIVE